MYFFITAISVLYAGVGIAALIGYLPTIKDLWHHKKASANMSSYGIWTATSLVTFLYSVFVVPDFLFQVVSLVNLVCCGLILVLMLALQKRAK